MLSIGLDITLELEQNETKKKYKGKIADLDDANVFIYYPINIDTHKVAYLPAGSKLTVFFVDEQSAVYTFDTEVIQTVKDAVPLLQLARPKDGDIQKVQRREYVRVDAPVPISMRFPDKEIEFETVTDNISAGGCAARIPEGIALEKGDRGFVDLAVKMKSGQQFHLTFGCEVIRIFTKNDIPFLSMKYVNPDRDDQKILTRFCFEKQLEYRKKGYWR
jgi:c-di-GMP-binding flagellar brake protein YcgR